MRKARFTPPKHSVVSLLFSPRFSRYSKGVKSIFLSLLVLLVGPLCAKAQNEPAPMMKVLVITGGHGFEEEPFFAMFAKNPAITFIHAAHSKGTSDAYDRPDLYSFDVIVLYDMVQNISDEQKARFKGLIERGIGLVVLHHAIVSYQSWPEFERIIGGTYPEPQDKKGVVTEMLGYEHDVDIPVKIVTKDHPITAELNDFTLKDEIYWGYRTGADITPLLTTTHPKSGKPLAWARQEGKSRVTYIQLGHGQIAFKNGNFQQLLAQAIQWAGSHHKK